MQWITHKLYRTFTTRFTISALSYVLSLATLPLVAVASDADVSHIMGTLDILNSYIQSDLTDQLYGWQSAELSALAAVVPSQYQDRVVTALTGTDMNGISQNPYHNVNAYLEALLRAFYGSVPNNNYPVSYSLSDYMSEMRYYLASMYLFQQTNRPSSSSSSFQDILAGNPWWATNSAFALVAGAYDMVYPDDGREQLSSFSFPQFMSKWSAKLSAPSGSGSLTPQSAMDLWGLASFRQWGNSSQQGFTWFDWVADAMRSNWLLQASAIDSASTDSDYIVNHLDTISDSVYRNEFYSYSNSVASSSNLVLMTSTVSTNDLMEFADNPLNTESEPMTNGLPSFELQLGSIDGNPFSGFDVENLLPNWEGHGSPNIVVIPEMTIGGIHVPMGQGDFLSFSNTDPNSVIVGMVKSLCRWAWNVMCFVGLFIIVRNEFNFWSTLGGSASD